MKRVYIILLTCTFISLAYYRHLEPLQPKQSKKTHVLQGNKKKPDREPLFGTIQASDGEQLAYGAYVPKSPEALLLFYHGSGAHGGAGYTYMAEQLSNNYTIATYLFDMRGHGRSGGQRGHTPTPQQIWDDVLSAFNWAQEQYPDLPIFLGGHSGGAGVLLNYAQWSEHEEPAGYMFVTPFFGREVDIFRERKEKSKSSFVNVHHSALLTNMLTGGVLGGDWIGMTMHYPEHYVTELGFVNTYTVNMIHAINAKKPLATLQEMKVPTYICIADKDELFDPCKFDQVLSPIEQLNSLVYTVHFENALHLTILGEVDDHIGKVIQAVAQSRA